MRLPLGVRLLLRTAGWLAPSCERHALVAEWTAELRAHRKWLRKQRPNSGAVALHAQATGALVDALVRRWDTAVSGLFADMRFGVRGLVRQPAFTLLAVATLGLGIGATSAIYTLFDRVLLRPLPYEDPSTLVSIWGRNVADSSRQVFTSQADFVDYVAGSRTFRSLVGIEGRVSILRVGAGTPEKLLGADHTYGLFQTLGVEVDLGRSATIAEHADRTPVVVLSAWLWEHLFGTDRDLVNKTVEIDGLVHAVIGVMPEAFEFPTGARYWIPFNARRGDEVTNASDDGFGRDWRTLRVLGRLHPDGSIRSANADIERIAANLTAEHPTTNTDHTAYVEPLQVATVGNVARPLFALLGAVSLVLAVACANVGGLLLARTRRRHTELAVRAALGAGRWRVIRLLLSESLLIAALSGGVGLFTGHTLLEFFLRRSPVDIPRVDAVALDLRIAVAMFVVTAAAGILIGLASAIVATRRDVYPTLRGAAGQGGGGARGRRFLESLVIVQVALSTILVVGAALLTSSFTNLMAVDHGYRTERILTFQLNIGFDRYPGWDRFTDFFARSREAVRSIAGIEAVEHINVPPLRAGWQDWYHVVGTPEVERGARPHASLRAITTDFFEMTGLQIVVGRGFRGGDTQHAKGVAIVNETFARTAFQDREALGQRIEKPQFWGDEFPAVHEIVGIVQDSRSDGLGIAPSPTIYFPFDQMPFGGNTLFVRTALNVATLAPLLRDAIMQLDPLLPVEELKSVNDMVDESAAVPRFAMLLSGGFGLLALVVANIGLYGVLSYSVAERTAELGLRRALGAGGTRLMAGVIRRGLLLAGSGITLGLVGSWMVRQVVESAVYGVTVSDPRVYLVVATSLGLIAVLASGIPASRAFRANPATAMTERH